MILLLSLGLDTFAVALGLGLSGLPRSEWRRVGLVFAVFEGGMPVVGLLAGHGASRAMGAWAGYIAAGLLIVVGLYAIREAREEKENEDDEDKKPAEAEGANPQGKRLEGRQLLLAGLSVSLDELAVGFSLGLLRVALAPALSYIGLQAFAITFAGLSLGTRLGARLGDKAELASGLVLTLLGIALLINQAGGSHFLY